MPWSADTDQHYDARENKAKQPYSDFAWSAEEVEVINSPTTRTHTNISTHFFLQIRDLHLGAAEIAKELQFQ